MAEGADGVVGLAGLEVESPPDAYRHVQSVWVAPAHRRQGGTENRVSSATIRGAVMGRHKTRTDLGREFGATDVVAERGHEGVEKVRELTCGEGAHVVLEAVGARPAYDQSVGIVGPGGTISRVGVPQYEEAPVGFGSLFGGNVTLTGGPAPTHAYVETLLPKVLDGSIEPGKVFDRTIGLDGVPDGHRAMADREALKVLVRP